MRSESKCIVGLIIVGEKSVIGKIVAVCNADLEIEELSR